MKKMTAFLSGLFLFGMTGICFAGDFTAAVYKLQTTSSGSTELVPVTTGVTYHALTVNTDTLATMTVFGDGAATAKTNPVTTTVFATDGKIKFRVADTTSVDLIVTDTAGGYTETVEGFATTDHRVVIDERANIPHAGMYRATCVGTAGAETDTGIDFAYDTYIHGAQFDTTTNSGDSIDIGLLSSETSGDADGLLVDMSSGVTGVATLSLASSGAYLDNGTIFYPMGHIVYGANAKSLTYTCTGPMTSVGYVIYQFTKVR